jgi:hypothetical protein
LLPDEEVEDDFPNRVFVFLFFSFSLSHLFNKLCKGPKGICIFIWMTDGWWWSSSSFWNVQDQLI